LLINSYILAIHIGYVDINDRVVIVGFNIKVKPYAKRYSLA